jgi:hypothetical protein
MITIFFCEIPGQNLYPGLDHDLFASLQAACVEEYSLTVFGARAIQDAASGLKINLTTLRIGEEILCHLIGGYQIWSINGYGQPALQKHLE